MHRSAGKEGLQVRGQGSDPREAGQRPRVSLLVRQVPRHDKAMIMDRRTQITRLETIVTGRLRLSRRRLTLLLYKEDPQHRGARNLAFSTAAQCAMASQEWRITAMARFRPEIKILVVCSSRTSQSHAI